MQHVPIRLFALVVAAASAGCDGARTDVPSAAGNTNGGTTTAAASTGASNTGTAGGDTTGVSPGVGMAGAAGSGSNAPLAPASSVVRTGSSSGH